MIRIEDRTIFEADITTVFDAERDISLHQATQGHRDERAAGGVISGLIECGQEVEWEAVHFGIKQRLRVRITRMEKPTSFRDEQVSGAFASMRHDHLFVALGQGRTEKTDIMEIRAPLGPLGWLAEVLFLRVYMTAFLRKKNLELKALVEKGRAGNA